MIVNADLPDFLQPLEFLTRPFPREAVETALARREESVPHLLHALEWAGQHPDEANDARPPYMLHLYALFILAQFREKRGYAPIIRLFRNPRYEELTGYVATENLGNILASVCGGDTSLIESLLEDEAVDEWVRGGAAMSLGVLMRSGIKTRAGISGYIGTLFRRLEREPGNVWDSLIAVCTDFGMTEHLDQIRALYHDGIADPFVDILEDLETEIALPPGSPGARADMARYDLIDDAIAELEWWHCFTPKAAEEDLEDDLDDIDAMEDDIMAEETFERAGAPVIRESPKVGRNDPCPCGSGKKYKKCCGQLGAA